MRLVAQRASHLGLILVPLLWLRAQSIQAQVSDQTTDRSTQSWELQAGMVIEPEERDGYDLSRIGDLVASVSGRRVYLTQPDRGEVWVFDSSGTRIGTLGREGTGPGEFRRIGPLGWRGDTLWVADAASMRLTLFDADSVVRSIGFRLAGNRPWMSAVRPLALLSDGSVLGGANIASFWLRKGHQIRQPLLRITEDGEVIDTLVWITHRNRATVVTTPRSSRVYFPQPFSDSDLWHVSRNGAYLAVVSRPSSSYMVRLTVVSAIGDTLFATGIPFTPQPLTEAEVERALQSLVDGAGNPSWNSPTFRQNLREELFVPEFCPPATRVRVTDDAKVWLRRQDCQSTEQIRWDVFDGDGKHLAHVEVNADGRILHVSGTALWEVASDSLDRPIVRRWDVIRQR